jgi:hypothetical protein
MTTGDARMFGLQCLELLPQEAYLSLIFLACGKPLLPTCDLPSEPAIFIG